MSTIPPTTSSNALSAMKSFERVARDKGGETNKTSKTSSSNREVADRFRPESGVTRVKQDAAKIEADPTKPFASSNGLIISPNAGIAEQTVGKKSGGIGLAFDSPIMHINRQSGDSKVDVLS